MAHVGSSGKTDTEYHECQKDDCGKDYVAVSTTINPPKSETIDRPDKTQQTHTAISLSIVEKVLLKYFSPLPVAAVMGVLREKQQ